MFGSNNNWMHAPHQKEIADFAKWYNENEKEKAPEAAPKKQMEDFAKWLETPEAKKASEGAKSKAWKNFLAKFPNADKSKFEAQVYFEKDHTGKGEIYFKKGQGFFTSVFGSDSKYWSPEMKAALGKQSAFPPQLMPIGLKGSSLPIPAVSFDSAAPSLKKIFNNSIDIYATLDQYFTVKFREIFQKTRLTHHSGKESKNGLEAPT